MEWVKSGADDILVRAFENDEMKILEGKFKGANAKQRRTQAWQALADEISKYLNEVFT